MPTKTKVQQIDVIYEDGGRYWMYIDGKLSNHSTEFSTLDIITAAAGKPTVMRYGDLWRLDDYEFYGPDDLSGFERSEIEIRVDWRDSSGRVAAKFKRGDSVKITEYARRMRGCKCDTEFIDCRCEAYAAVGKVVRVSRKGVDLNKGVATSVLVQFPGLPSEHWEPNFLKHA